MKRSEAQPEQGGQGADRQAFLARVRQALGRTQPLANPPAPPGLDEAPVRLVPPSADLVERFAGQAAAMGMTVQRLKAAEVLRRIVALVGELNLKRVVVGVGTLPQALGLGDSLRRKGVEVVDWRSVGLDAQYEVDAGITDVHAAIAETGSLVCAADPGHSRGLSLIPPVHVAIVRKSDIVPDGVDYWRRAAAAGATRKSSDVVLITGPSKTADIEGILVTGVHGPGRVVVLLVEDA